MNTLAKWMMVLLVAVLGASCSSSKHRRLWVNYAEAMSKVRATAASKGIPREKVFYHFRLWGVPSARHPTGGRGAYASDVECWNLPDGHTLTAYKHWRHLIVDSKGAFSERFQPGSMVDSGEKYHEPDEMHYHEPRLEPYFDTLILTDQNKKVVGRIELPYR